MRRALATFSLLGLTLLYAGYLTNKSCNECHPDIYDEYESSWHAKTWFNDTLHRKVAQKIPVYDCGRCHMPAATNLAEMEAGKTWPREFHQEQKDAISCFFCHQIAYVKEAHRFNENVLAKQAEGYKPTLYGSLENPDETDKHGSVKSPIYDKYACMGCHAHKRNAQGVLIFRTMKKGQDSKGCIKCHMPYTDGPPEKMNKRARNRHRSHAFAGIHDAAMRQKSVDLNVSVSDRTLSVSVTNRMGHPLIVQPARMKYLDIRIYRGDKQIWRNFQSSPREDRQACFVTDFLDQKGNPAPIPFFAYKRGFVNNLDANATKTLHYKVPPLRKHDRIVVAMYVVLAKPECAAAAGVKEKALTAPLLMKRIEKEVQ